MAVNGQLITRSRGGSDRAGESVCNSGSRTGYDCGIHRDKSYDFSKTLDDGRSANFKYMRKAGYSCLAGDSGGPILYGSQAKGIHYGGQGTSHRYYTHIDDALSMNGLADVKTW